MPRFSLVGVTQLGSIRQRHEEKAPAVVIDTALKPGSAPLPVLKERTPIAPISWSCRLSSLGLYRPRSCSLNRDARHHHPTRSHLALVVLFHFHFILLLVLLHPPCAAEPPSQCFLVPLISCRKLSISVLGSFLLFLGLFSRMALVEPVSYSHSSAIHGPRDTGLLGPILPYSPPYRENGKIHEPIDQFNLTSELKGIDGLGTLGLHGLDRFDLTLKESWVDVNSAPSDPRSSGPISDSEVGEKSQDFCVASSNPQSRSPFRKWMKSIHRRAAHRPSVRRHHHHPPWSSSDIGDIGHVSGDSRLQRQTSSSGSSFGFVEAVRSASVSLASVSSVNRSRRNTARSTAFSKTDRSSRASVSGARISEDSVVAEKPVPRQDAAVTERALRRRRVLEEIITTEESYIGDVRFLINVRLRPFLLSLSNSLKVYITILASLPSQAVGLRSSINRNLTDIVELHEELLGELHRVVPNSEYSHSDNQQSIPLPTNRRWRSLNAVPEHDDGSPLIQGVSGLLADPQVAADVARVFGKRVSMGAQSSLLFG